MERRNKREKHDPRQPDYQSMIAEFVGSTIPEINFPAETTRVMAEGLLDSYRRSGNGQRNKRRKSYHNDEHQYEVFVRSFEWLGRFEEYFDVKFTQEDYEIAGIAACYHDNVVRLNGHSHKTSDEELSARAAMTAIERSNTDYSDDFKARVHKAILATTVDHSANIIEQSQALSGEPDPVAIAIALADAGAVLTEDASKIIEDVSKLSIEGFHGQTPDDTALTNLVMKILAGEETFIMQRFEDLEKYMSFMISDPDKSREIVDKYFTERRENILRFTTELEAKYDAIHDSIREALENTSTKAEQTSTKIRAAIMHGLDWLH